MTEHQKKIRVEYGSLYITKLDIPSAKKDIYQVNVIHQCGNAYLSFDSEQLEQLITLIDELLNEVKDKKEFTQLTQP